MARDCTCASHSPCCCKCVRRSARSIWSTLRIEPELLQCRTRLFFQRSESVSKQSWQSWKLTDLQKITSSVSGESEKCALSTTFLYQSNKERSSGFSEPTAPAKQRRLNS